MPKEGLCMSTHIGDTSRGGERVDASTQAPEAYHHVSTDNVEARTHDAGFHGEATRLGAAY